MKLHHILIITAALLAQSACEKQPIRGNTKDGVNDALDRRPGENVRDAAEDAADAVKEAGKDVKDAVKESTK